MSKGKTDNSIRFDASAFSDEVLETASSKGLLRRSHRDLESGLVRLAGWDDGTALVEADGETVRLPGGPLSGATCSCPANGLCRHILSSILFMRETVETTPPAAVEVTSQDAPPAEPVAEKPTPDLRAEILALDEASIVKSFGRAAYVRAQAMLAALEPEAIRIEPAANTLRIELGTHPAVLYAAGGGPAGMVSKAPMSERAVLHAAALLAIRGPAGPAETEEEETDEPVAASDLLSETAALLRDAARQALSKAPAGLEERIADLTLSSRTEAIPRLAAELRTIAAMIRRRRDRLDSAEPAELLGMIARSYALVEALRVRPADPLLTGSGGETPQALPPLELTGCGLRLWQTESGARGVTGYYLSADGRHFSTTLARAAGSEPSFTPRGAATGETVFGRSLAALAGARFRLEGGAATSDGRLHASRGRAEVMETGWTTALSGIDSGIIDDWHLCAQRLASTFRPHLAAPPRRARALVLSPARLGPLRFDGVAQAGRWPICDHNGAWLDLEIEGNEQLDGKFALIGKLDQRQPPVIVVLAEPRGMDIVLSPLGFGTDGLTVLDLPPVQPPVTEQKTSWLSRLSESLSLAGRSGQKTANEMQFEAMARSKAVGMQLAATAFDRILALAELGGRMEDPDRLQNIEELGHALEEAGLVLPGRLVTQLAAASRQTRPTNLLRAAYALDLLGRMEPGLPFIRPVI